MKFQKVRIGDLLVNKGLITEAQLKVALEEQKKVKEKLGSILVKMGYITEEKLLEALSEQLNVKIVKANEVRITLDLKKIIPEEKAKRLNVVPIKVEDKFIHVATPDPTNLFALDEIARITNREVVPYLILEKDFITLYSKIYGIDDKLYNIAKEIERKIIEAGGDERFLEKLAEEAPAIQLVDSIIERAIIENASDIHIEPDEDELRIRYRIDGILHEILSLNHVLTSPVISRIKIMSNMNIAEKRIPQDGRFKIKISNREVDFRVSTLPTIYGEKAVIRILEKNPELLNLKRLGLDPKILDIYQSLITQPYGIILISGPTGSGKTTTLYATLNQLNSIEKNIITVEDPVEYKFKLINQVQVDEKAGLTFSSALRSILRQDPDIVMIGEIRDKVTAEIAIQASLTGHLVLSTIHTNDAISSISRLIDMGIDPHLVSSSIIGVASQRLVRKICENCKEKIVIEKEFINLDLFDESLKIDKEFEKLIERGWSIYYGKGCEECRGTGYKGRTVIFELLEITPEIKDAINKGESLHRIKEIAISQGFTTMFNYGIKLANKGVTTIEEVLRVTIMER